MFELFPLEVVTGSESRGITWMPGNSRRCHLEYGANYHGGSGLRVSWQSRWLPGNRVDAISSTLPGSESRGNHVDAGQSRRCLLEYGANYFRAVQ